MSDTPKIYVADLKSYNEGRLIGEHIDLSEYDSGSEVMDKISELMDEYSEKYHDGEETEYAIHDYENFDSSLYSEYMGESEFDTIISAYKILDNYPELNMEVITEIMSDYNLEGDEVEEWIDERYVGKFDSDEDLGYHFVEMVGGIENVSNSDFYFDYEKLGRDLSINDYTQYGDVYFNNYKHGGKVKNTPRYSYAHGGKIGDLRVVDIEWRQLSDKGIGRYYLTENDVEKLEDEYGATYYFEYYDDSDDMKMRTPYSKMKMILDQEMKDKGLMDDIPFAKGGLTYMPKDSGMVDYMTKKPILKDERFVVYFAEGSFDKPIVSSIKIAKSKRGAETIRKRLAKSKEFNNNDYSLIMQPMDKFYKEYPNLFAV